MTYHSDHSPDAARHNQLDRTQSGILDFDTRNTINEGQAAIALGSGSTAIEVDLEGANVLIDGSKVSAPPNTVTLSDGHDSLWRLDHIYISESGGYSVQEGEPQTNEYVTHSISNGSVTQDIQSNEVAGGPRPKGTDFAATQGELVYSILVPPGATTAQDLSTQHIQDRRRPAPDVLDLGPPRQPTISAEGKEYPAGDWRIYHVVTTGGQTFRLWQYSLSMVQYGMITSSDFTIYLIDYSDVEQIPPSEFESDSGVDWSEYAIWETSDTRASYTESEDEEPLVSIDITGSYDAFGFVVANESEYAYTADYERLSFQATHTIEDTDDL